MKMKKILPFVLVGILVIAGVVLGSRFLLKKSIVQPEFFEEEPPAKPTEKEAEEKPEEENLVNSLKDALSLGKSVKCTWKKDEKNYGTAQIKNNKSYSEVTAEGRKMYSIFVDNCTYTWVEAENQGVKFCVEPGEKETVSEPETSSWETPDISYSCTPSIISEAIFNPPSEVEFINPFEAMEGTNLPEGVQE